MRQRRPSPPSRFPFLKLNTASPHPSLHRCFLLPPLQPQATPCPPPHRASFHAALQTRRSAARRPCDPGQGPRPSPCFVLVLSDKNLWTDDGGAVELIHSLVDS